MPETKQKSPDFFLSLNNFVRRHREMLWLATRFLTDARRKRALCILCLDAEFQRIATTVNDEMVGLIRLQWWRDETKKILKGETSQQTLAAQSLSFVLDQSPETADPIIALIDAYDDQLTSGQGNVHSKLFGALLANLPDGEKLSETAGEIMHSAQSGQLNTAARDNLIAGLANVSNEAWPWVCLLEFTRDWMRGRKPGAFEMRWRIWKAFLGGEKRLAKKLRAL